MTRILYISWDAPEATYLEGLFLPAFEALAARGHAFDIVQFRWGDPAATARVAARCAAAGIGYRAVPIERRWGSAGALASAIAGGRAVSDAAREFRSDIVMPRSLFAGLATLSAVGLRGRPLLFEADGLAADERAEFGGLGHGIGYRLLRAVERRLARRTRAITVRTEAARAIIAERGGVDPARIFVVPNGRDPALFTPGDAAARGRVRATLGIAGETPLLVHAGSLGPQYRPDQIAALMRAVLARRPDARLLLLHNDPGAARAALAAHDPALADSALIRAAAHDEVPAWLAAADLGLAFRGSSLSTRAVAPVKLGEYLLCGDPVVGNAQVGETRAAIAAGVFFDDAAGLDAAASWFDCEAMPAREALRAASRAVGVEQYSLDRMVDAYARAIALVLGVGE